MGGGCMPLPIVMWIWDNSFAVLLVLVVVPSVSERKASISQHRQLVVCLYLGHLHGFFQVQAFKKSASLQVPW